MSADDERAARVVQLVVHDRGAGVLELQFEQDGAVIGGCALSYPQQGSILRYGEPSREAQRAAALNAAAVDLNRLLDRWCS